MTDLILRNFSIGVIAISSTVGATILIGSSWYDIAQTRRARQAKKTAKGQRQARPLVSVIIYSQNQAEQTLSCLASVLKSSQRKLEAIVVNNGSSDQTKLVLKEFAKQHPKRAIRVINKRQSASLEIAVKTGLRTAKGDIILVVSAEYSLGRQALARAADAFVISQDVALIPALLIKDYPSTLNLWLRFKSLLNLNWQKTASLLRPSGSGLHFGVFYGRQMAKRPKVDQDYRFASDIALMRQPSPSISSSSVVWHQVAVVAKKGGKKSALRPLLRGFGLVYRLLALPIFTWYALYLAMNQGYSYLLFMGWAIFTFLYIFVVWTSEYHTFAAKVKLTALAPAIFSLAIIMIFVEAVAKILGYIPLLK